MFLFLALILGSFMVGIVFSETSLTKLYIIMAIVVIALTIFYYVAPSYI